MSPHLVMEACDQYTYMTIIRVLSSIVRSYASLIFISSHLLWSLPLILMFISTLRRVFLMWFSPFPLQ